ncbi:hypothetical protein EJB05_21805, partial [Eragrostis curvula]
LPSSRSSQRRCSPTYHICLAPSISAAAAPPISTAAAPVPLHRISSISTSHPPLLTPKVSKQAVRLFLRLRRIRGGGGWIQQRIHLCASSRLGRAPWNIVGTWERKCQVYHYNVYRLLMQL